MLLRLLLSSVVVTVARTIVISTLFERVHLHIRTPAHTTTTAADISRGGRSCCLGQIEMTVIIAHVDTTTELLLLLLLQRRRAISSAFALATR
jgi:hypothetical protein